MVNYLNVELDIYYGINDDEGDLEKDIIDTMVSQQSEFYELMGGVSSTQDSRAELLEDTLEVHSIDLVNNTGTASISYDYDAYNGCKDMDQGGTIEEEWKFELDGKKIKFKLLLPELYRDDEI